MAFTQEQVNNWFTANPNATEAQVAETVRGLGGLDAHPGLAGMIGQHYGVDANNVQNAYTAQNNAALQNWVGSNAGANDVQIAQQMQNLGVTPQQAATTMGWNPTETETRYAAATPFATMANQYAAGDYTGINSLLNQNKYTGDQITSQFGLTQPQLDEIRGKGVNLGYTTPEMKNYVSSIVGDKTLQPWEQANKILETGQAKGFDQAALEKLYGKDTMQPYLTAYKTQIGDFLTNLENNKDLSAMSKLGLTHGATTKYGTSVDDLVTYGGLSKEAAQSLFDNYDKGLGSLVAKLNDPKVDDLTKTQLGLTATSKWGSTDADLARLSNGKWSEKDVSSFLDPVRNVPKNLFNLMSDPTATAADVTKFVTDAKKDPRAAGIYGTILDQTLTKAMPSLVLKDAQSGKGDYQDFLTLAKSTPELATQYAPQISAIEGAMSIIGKHALNKDFGGEYPAWAMQMFTGLDPNIAKQAPKQLEMSPAKTEKRSTYGESGALEEYDFTTPLQAKSVKGLQPIGGGFDPDTNAQLPIEGYRQKVDSTTFGDGRNAVYATYDTNGKLTGYESGARVHVSDPQYFQARWDANGNPRPETGANRSGGVRGMVKDMASNPVMGTIMNVAAAYFGGPAGVAALAAVQGVPPEEIAKRAALAYVASEIGGQVSGSEGVQSALGPTGSQVAGQVAGSTGAGLLAGQDFGDALTNAALSAGTNLAANTGLTSLLGQVDFDKLGSFKPYATGLASNVISGLVTGQTPDLQKTLTNTAMKEAMKSGKDTLKTAAKP